jgi:hypothetical protein
MVRDNPRRADDLTGTVHAKAVVRCKHGVQQVLARAQQDTALVHSALAVVLHAEEAFGSIA